MRRLPGSALVLALLVIPTAAQEVNTARTVAAVLERSGAEEPAPLVRQLVRLGPEAIPSLFRAYCGLGSADAPEASVAVALETLLALPAEDVVAHVARGAERRAPVGVLLASARVLGAVGTPDTVDGLLAIVAAVEERKLHSRSVQGTLRTALATSLSRSPEAWRRLAAARPSLAGPRGAIVLDAVVATDSPRGTELLGDWLAETPQPHPLLVRRLGEQQARFPWTDSGGRERLALLLAVDDPELRREAALACGRARAVASAPDLLRLLGDVDPTVAAAASWALGEMGGAGPYPSAADWRRWLRRERDFWNETGSALATGLASSDDEHFLESVRTLCAHPLFRDEAARALGDALAHADAQSTRRLCTALARIGSQAAVPELVEALSASSAAVRRSAFDALRQLTGRDLPARPEAWQALVGPS